MLYKLHLQLVKLAVAPVANARTVSNRETVKENDPSDATIVCLTIVPPTPVIGSAPFTNCTVIGKFPTFLTYPDEKINSFEFVA